MLQKTNGVLSFGTLIHSGDFKLPLPCLGQISIGRVGQISIGTNTNITFAMQAGADGYIVKPFLNATLLKQTINHILSKRDVPA